MGSHGGPQPPSRGCSLQGRRGALTAYALLLADALAGKADASALAALLSTVDGLDSPLEVDTKI